MNKKLAFIIFLITNSCNINAKNIDIDKTIGFKSYLSINTWEDSERYDSSHFLLVPMYYIYENKKSDSIKILDSHINEFLKTGFKNISYNKKGGNLTALQYYYFLSEYLLLSNNDNTELSQFLIKQIDFFWESPKLIENAKQRTTRQLNSSSSSGYKRGLLDEDLFLFGISANLTQFFPKNENLQKINKQALNFLKQRSSFTNKGGWLFEKGDWDDYPDRAYAGYNSKIGIAEKKPLKDMVSDSSHFQRWPKILLSIQNSYPQNSTEYLLLQKYRTGLSKQFLSEVVHVNNNKIQLKNYMDGKNGIYRWNYSTLGQGKGYGPYELTSSFGLGWWVFLKNKQVSILYSNYYKQISNKNSDKNCAIFFNKIISSRLIDDRKQFNNCMFIFNSYFASKLWSYA